MRRRRVDGGITWSPQIAYALGLMATDGNLSGRKGPMSLVSRDIDQIETLRHCLQLEAPISRVRSSTGFLHKVQWHDHDLYDWFLSVGLTPAKSRTIGPLAVPDELFADFFRGCIDGDGSVLVCTDTYHAAKCAHYVYERLYVSLVSASRRFDRHRWQSLEEARPDCDHVERYRLARARATTIEAQYRHQTASRWIRDSLSSSRLERPPFV